MRKTRPASSYGEDRAAIEDLQARYLFALDFHDPDLYLSTFTEDGVLDYGSGDVKGRQAIKDVTARMPSPKVPKLLRASEPAPPVTIFRTLSSRWMAIRQRACPTGFTTPMTIRTGVVFSTASVTMKTN